MSYPVFLLENNGMPRNHHALFVRLNENKSGELFQVTGNIQQGMTFERRATHSPDDSADFIAMTQIGLVSSRNLDSFAATCESNPPPAKQFNGAKRLNPKEPLRRCQEWTAETIQLLKQDGILEDQGAGASSSGGSWTLHLGLRRWPGRQIIESN